MAHPSPSPSGISSSRRRLSEVLGEQQEPFYLDLYLLERGCSPPAFLDASACGSGAWSTCWPKTRGTVRTLRRPARNKKGSRRSGVLRVLLSKILSGASTTAPAMTKQNRQQRAAIGWRRVVVAEKQRMPADRFGLVIQSASPGAGAVEAHMEDDDGEQEDDEEEDESSKKQLSPVSVLEQSLFEHSPLPPPPHATKALAIFGELLESAYTPNTLLDDVVAIAGDRNSSTQSKDSRGSSSITDSSTPPRCRRKKKKKKKKHHARRKEDVALEKDLGGLSSLVVSEMAGAASVRAEDLRPSVEDVGVLIAAAVMEALTEETAAELMGIDGPWLCG